MRYIVVSILLAIGGCASSVTNLPFVTAVVETAPVASSGDAADDPAIWVNQSDSGKSIILGTDKKSGLFVYDLSGNEIQFLPTGALNNVDLRQNTQFGDIAGASNRSNNTIALYTIENGVLSETGSFPSEINEPYGFCFGQIDSEVFAFVAHKTGDLIAYRVHGSTSGSPVGRMKLQTQLEGCVFDDEEGVIYIGEEARGIWKANFMDGVFSSPTLIDEVDGESGIKADVEGLAIYRKQSGKRYLIASSQGNNSFAVYDLTDNSFLTRFEIRSNGEIDGVQETDGIAVVSNPLGAEFPRGILVVQDGQNHPRGELQNFKFVDWREIERLIVVPPTD